MSTYFFVALGSALGGIARYSINHIPLRLFGMNFPWSTLLVNVSGSLLIGVLAAALPADAKWFAAGDARAFLIVGLCGGFTTFSTFSLETMNLMRAGAWPTAFGYIAASVLLCLMFVGLGYYATLTLQR